MDFSTPTGNSKTAFCPACGSGAIAKCWPTYRVEGGKHICWCASCELGWQHPLPQREEIQAHFDGSIYMIQSEPEKNKGFKRRIRRLNQFVPQRGHLLDVGCGFGHFMYLAQKAGWHVKGIDPHKKAVEHCRRHYGFHVELNVMENRQFQPESFKALTLWDVWEHVYNPVAFMDQCIEMLAPGGILAVAIPNASGWPARLFKGHWRYIMITHLSYFRMSYVYKLMDQRHMTCIKADHTFKLHSILEGLLAKLHVSLNMERVIRMGRHGGLEEKIPESTPTSQSKGGQSATSRLTYQLRQTALRLNLWRFSSPIGDMVDLYFRKS